MMGFSPLRNVRVRKDLMRHGKAGEESCASDKHGWRGMAGKDG
jgi:hypothetical protein